MKLLTVHECAEILGRTEPQLRWLIHTGKAPKSAMSGGRRMFRDTDIDAYIAEAFAEAAA